MVFTKTHNSIIMRLTYKNHFRFKKKKPKKWNTFLYPPSWFTHGGRSLNIAVLKKGQPLPLPQLCVSRRGSSINHVDSFLDILDPNLFAILQNKAYVVMKKWLTPSPSMSTWFTDALRWSFQSLFTAAFKILTLC